MASKWQSFFSSTNIPQDYEATIKRLDDFVKLNNSLSRKTVLVSSGGTTVPLESRTVRFIDNFSVGTRGSTSAEYFLSKGYAVVFLHRRGSLEPFKRHFQHTNFLDLLTLENGSPTVANENQEKITKIYRDYKEAQETSRLFNVPFTSLSEYLYLLKGSAQMLSQCDKNVMFYLAAAVSDFYIPNEEMPEHKIQSSDGPLQISLQMVPKMLEPLVIEWAPRAFVTSFKLETDQKLLIPKSKKALDRYQHQVVIGNILETRKREVIIVTADNEETICLSDQEMSSGHEIEENIIAKLVEIHSKYISE